MDLKPSSQFSPGPLWWLSGLPARVSCEHKLLGAEEGSFFQWPFPSQKELKCELPLL